MLIEAVPGPGRRPGRPLQAHVTNLDATTYLGRIALCRVRAGRIRRGQQVAWCREDGTITRVKVTELLRTEALTRVSAECADAGDIVAVAGIAGRHHRRHPRRPGQPASRCPGSTSTSRRSR